MIAARICVLSIRGLIFASLLFLMGSLSPVSAQERLTDTLRIVDATIMPGDTGSVFIYIANSEPLGGYSVRFTYDTAFCEVITKEGNNFLEAYQWREEFGLFNFRRVEPGIIAGIAATFNPPWGQPVGSDTTVQLFFYMKEYAPWGVGTAFVFENHPLDTNISNWFSGTSGLYQYRPVRISGIISTPDAPPLTLHQNRPNPFWSGSGEETYFDFDLPVPGWTELSIYDLVGRKMKTVLSEDLFAGPHTVSWDGRDADGEYVPSGIYIYRLALDHRLGTVATLKPVIGKMAVMR